MSSFVLSLRPSLAMGTSGSSHLSYTNKNRRYSHLSDLVSSTSERRVAVLPFGPNRGSSQSLGETLELLDVGRVREGKAARGRVQKRLEDSALDTG